MKVSLFTRKILFFLPHWKYDLFESQMSHQIPQHKIPADSSAHKAKCKRHVEENAALLS